MVVSRVGTMSFAKIMGVLYALFGLIFGALFSVIGMVGGAMAPEGSEAGIAGMLFGVGAIVILPLLYGCFGFIGGLIGGFLYNLVAGWVGGVELEVQ